METYFLRGRGPVSWYWEISVRNDTLASIIPTPLFFPKLEDCFSLSQVVTDDAVRILSVFNFELLRLMRI